MKRSHSVVKAALLSMLMCFQAASGHSSNEAPDTGIATLKPLVSKASLIVFGKVADIQYRNSEPTKEQPHGLPHTFVTYKVREILHGKGPDDTVTLKIPGGADGRGGIYTETSSPVFSRGESDILFIRGGEVAGCHLVECVEGRFRVFQDKVYNGWGIPVVEARKALRIGGVARFDLNIMEIPRPDFDTILEHPGVREHLKKEMQAKGLSMDEMRKRYQEEAPEFTTIKFGLESKPANKDKTEEPEAKPVEKFGAPINVGAFVDAIKHWSDELGTPRERFFAADPKARFVVPDPKLDSLNAESPRFVPPSREEREDKHLKEGH